MQVVTGSTRQMSYWLENLRNGKREPSQWQLSEQVVFPWLLCLFIIYILFFFCTSYQFRVLLSCHHSDIITLWQGKCSDNIQVKQALWSTKPTCGRFLTVEDSFCQLSHSLLLMLSLEIRITSLSTTSSESMPSHSFKTLHILWPICTSFFEESTTDNRIKKIGD